MDHRQIIFVVSLICLCGTLQSLAAASDVTWWDPDAFDDIQDRIDAVSEDNCRNMSSEELHLPYNVLSQLPVYHKLDEWDVPENRSNLLLLHNMALNRALFYSYIMQRLNTSSGFQPGLMYYYLSAAVDTGPTHNASINGSGILYDTNCSFPNWYLDLPFNRTLGLFGPRNWEVENCERLEDYGAGPNNNYTTEDYRINEWYDLYLPDTWDMAGFDHLRKYSYRVNITYGDGEGGYKYTALKVFFGPAMDLESNEFLPVTFTRPYFECGRSNTWIVDAVSPVVDHLPRYLDWYHLRRHKFVAVSTQSIIFQDIDHNQCPLGIGNEAPNYLAGTAKCKSTTECQPLPGFGFNRGGYECGCLPGLTYPPGQEGPFRGVDIERASEEEYEEGFDCIETEGDEIKPSNENQPKSQRNNNRKQQRRFVPKFTHNFGKKLSRRYNHKANKNTAEKILQQKESVTATTCKDLPKTLLSLPEETTYGIDKMFVNQGNANLRLALFLSAYLQNEKAPGQNLRPDPPMNVEQYFGEALATVMGDLHIVASGVFFDENKFEGPLGSRRYFAPWVYEIDGANYRGYDLSGEGGGYLQEDWFTEVKDKWSSSLNRLDTFSKPSYIRSDHDGSELVEHDTYYYKSLTNMTDGYWSQPVFPCDGKLDTWQVIHSLPFFGPANDTLDLEFKGVVTVTVLLDDLDINQCPMRLNEFNPFANTAVCPKEKPKCQPKRGGGFRLGQYTCSE